MKTAVALGLVLTLLFSHAFAIVQLIRIRGPLRGLLCVFLPVLAPLWAWDAGERRVAYVWCGAFVLYALSLAVM